MESRVGSLEGRHETMMLPPWDRHFSPLGHYGLLFFMTALSFCEKKERMVDVGAHIGFYTAHALRNFESVLSFEPHPELFECLRQNCVRAEIRQKGLWSTSGRGTLVIRKATNSGSGEMTVDPSGMVELSTLDEEIGDMEVSMLKIDVQGAEIEVLKGAERTLERTKPVVLCEGRANGPEERYLRSLGAHICVRVGQDFVAGWNRLCEHAAFISMPEYR